MKSESNNQSALQPYVRVYDDGFRSAPEPMTAQDAERINSMNQAYRVEPLKASAPIEPSAPLKDKTMGSEARHLSAIAECVMDSVERYYRPGGSASDLQSALHHLDSLRYQLTNTRRAIKVHLKMGHSIS